MLISAGLIIAINLLIFSYSDKIKALIVAEINKAASTSFNPDEVELNPFRSFPNITIELNNVFIKNPDEFSKIHNDTLFFSEKLRVKANAIKLAKGLIQMDEIQANRSSLNFITNSKGKTNINKVFLKEKKDSSSQSFSLDKIQGEALSFNLINTKTKSEISSQAEKFNLKLISNKGNIFIKSNIESNFSRLKLNAVDYIDKSINVNANAEFYKIDSSFFIKNGEIGTNHLNFNINGEVIDQKSKGTELNLTLRGKKLELSDLIDLVPLKNKKNITKLKSSGNLDAVLRIKGFVGKGNTPHIIADFGIENGSFTFRKETFSNIKFNGFFSNGPKNHPSTSLLHVKNFKSNLNESLLKGDFKIFNFRYPKIEAHLNSDINAPDFNFINDTIQFDSGRIKIKADITTSLNSTKNIKLKNLINPDFDVKIGISNTAIRNYDNKIKASNINSNILMNQRSIKIENLEAVYKENPIKLKVYSNNYMDYLRKKDSSIYLNGRIESPVLNINKFTQENQDSTADNKTFALPQKVKANLAIDIKKLFYKNITASNINAIIQNNEEKVSIKSLNFNINKGLVKGEASFEKRVNYVVKSNLKIIKVNIEELFSSFNNFGQETLKSEHIKGELSSKLQFGAALNKNLKIFMPTLTCNAEILINDGRLVNFEPVLSMSNFIEVSELKDIEFDILHNTISIRDEVIIIPEMEINSSALYIEGSGIHNFDNTFEYHISVLLSDILSRKAQKKRENNEFGRIADDGIRTMLPLKIVNEGDKTKTSYDRKKAREEIKENMEEEKKEIKDIFDQEFKGKKKKDTSKIEMDFENSGIEKNKEKSTNSEIKFEFE